MSLFPHYGAERIAAIDALAHRLLDVFVAAGYVRTEPAIMQPTSYILDREGEEMRGRTFIVTDPSGLEYCLRPELTIPVCVDHIETGGGYPARLCAHGPVFRHQPLDQHRPSQFYQAGVELLGEQDRIAADIEVLRLTIEAVRAGGIEHLDVKIGDLGLFSGLVDSLDVPMQWRGRLKRHFWRADYFEALLTRLSSGATNDSQRLLAHLGGLEHNEARKAIEGLLDFVGEAPLGARTREEIVERLIEQAADAAALRLDPAIARTISEMLAVTGPAPEALARIRALTSGMALREPLAAMDARLDALAALGVDPARVTFAARFGRNMEYYTGFVFELWSRDGEGPVQVAGGGRYDSLLEALGAGRSIPATGSAIRTERVLAARLAQGKA